MKFRLTLSFFFYLFVNICALQFKTFEKAVDTSTLNEFKGNDIIKILNLDKNSEILNVTDVEEAEVLKHKLTKSDIDNFENYLNSYLRFLRKFYKKDKNYTDSWAKNDQKHKIKLKTWLKNKTHVMIKQNISKINTTLIHKNHTLIEIKNNSNINNNLTKVVAKVTIIKSKNLNDSMTHIIHNSTIFINKNKSFVHLKNNNSQPLRLPLTLPPSKNLSSTPSSNNFNSTLKIDNFLLGLQSQPLTQSKSNKSSNNKQGNGTVTAICKNQSHFNTNDSLKSTNTTALTNLRKLKNSNLKNIKKIVHPKIELKNNSFYNKSISAPYINQELDKIYQNLKFNKLKDFERRQKAYYYRDNKSHIEPESLENNIYKKIVNLSLSLILIGLLMGILLGLILVMYFNTKKK